MHQAQVLPADSDVCAQSGERREDPKTPPREESLVGHMSKLRLRNLSMHSRDGSEDPLRNEVSAFDCHVPEQRGAFQSQPEASFRPQQRHGGRRQSDVSSESPFGHSSYAFNRASLGNREPSVQSSAAPIRY